ncbi:hypothetical protein V6Z11_D08G067900 [Gossypium hirsutum]
MYIAGIRPPLLVQLINGAIIGKLQWLKLLNLLPRAAGTLNHKFGNSSGVYLQCCFLLSMWRGRGVCDSKCGSRLSCPISEACSFNCRCNSFEVFSEYDWSSMFGSNEMT